MATASEVIDVYEDIVVKKGEECLVIRIKGIPLIYKLKSLHSLDLAVIGFTEGEDSKVRELLLALQNEDNTFTQIGRVGTGLSEDQKVSLYKILSKDIIDSPYIEADKRRVAFQMVKPAVVVEVSINDLLTETTKGTIKNSLIEYNESDGYSFISSVYGVSLLHPVFKRVRDDKSVNTHDLRFTK